MSEPVVTQAATAVPTTETSSAIVGKESTSISEVPITGPVQTQTPEEPQNALTKQFTDEEWAALKNFRVSIV